MSERVNTELTKDSAPSSSSLPTSQQIEGQKENQAPSVTQGNSQESRTQESSIEQSGGKDEQNATVPETLTSMPMDADDAQTHAILSAASNVVSDVHSAESKKRPGVMRQPSSRSTAREAHRMTYLQESPSSHLGKHPRSSSPSLHSGSSFIMAKDEDGPPEQKKPRVSKVVDVGAKSAYVVQRITHDAKAWQAPSFMQRQAAKEQKNAYDKMEVKLEEPESSHLEYAMNDVKGKGKQRADAVREHETGTSGPSTGLNPGVEKPQTSKKSRNVSNENDKSHSKIEKSRRARPRIASSTASSSRIKVEDIDDRPLLDGFTCDLTMRREPGGPAWHTWNDIMRIMLKKGRKRNRANQ